MLFGANITLYGILEAFLYSALNFLDCASAFFFDVKQSREIFLPFQYLNTESDSQGRFYITKMFPVADYTHHNLLKTEAFHLPRSKQKFGDLKDREVTSPFLQFGPFQGPLFHR